MGKVGLKFDWPLVGNAKIVEYWEKRIVSGQDMSGTLVFGGPSNLGKTTLAKHLAQILLCDSYRAGEGRLPCGQCPSCLAFARAPDGDDGDGAEPAPVLAHGDCHLLKKPKDKKNIPVEAVREFIRLLSLSSFLGRAKVGIIKNAEDLSEEAANALLKTLEEPKPGVTVILSCESPDALPKTIVSRSQVFNFRPVHPDRIYDHLIRERGAGRGLAKDLSRLALGRPALAVKFLEDKPALEARLARSRALVQAPGLDLNRRLALVSGLVPAEAAGQEAARAALKAINDWLGVVRDWFFLEYNLDDRVQHQSLLPELKESKRLMPAPRLLSLARRLAQAREDALANVPPRLVLEGVMITI